jgi:sugar lactone lactonase YvrE
MISMLRSVFAAISAVTSHHDSSPSPSRSKLAVRCAVVAALLSGMGKIALAQTAYFSGAQTTLGTGFSYPAAVAVDGNGNVYVADTLNNAVEEVLAVNGSIPASPTIITLGSGFTDPEGVAVDSMGDVFVADTGNGAAKEILAVNGTIPASPTIIILTTGESPKGIAVGASGNVFVALGCSGGNIAGDCGAVEEHVAVNGSLPASPNSTIFSPFDNPGGLAVDASGNVYVADDGDNAIKEILAVNGSVITDSMIATLYTFAGAAGPTGVAVDSSGNVYVADFGNNSAYELMAVNGSIPISPAINALGSGLKMPFGIAFGGNGNVYIADTFNNRVLNVSLSGANFGAVNIGAASPAIPMTFTFETAGTLGSTAVLTQGAAGLDFINAGTGTCAANTAYTAGETCTVNVIFTPTLSGTRFGAAVVEDIYGNALATGYVQGTGLGPQVNFLPGTEGTVASGFNTPAGTAVDASGNVYVADYYNGAVEEILAVNGSIPPSPVINTLSAGFSAPIGVAVDGAGNVFVADSNDNAVEEILAVNGSVPPLPTIIVLASGFYFPGAVAVDGNGNVFVADTGNNVVDEIMAVNGAFPASPIINTLGSGFIAPKSVAVDSSGNVYVSDYDNDAVKEILAVNGTIPASPTINTLLSNALNSGFAAPGGIAVDGRGNVIVANDGYDEIDEIQAVNGIMPASPTVISLANIAPGSGLDEPWGVAIDGFGNVFVADTGNNRIVKLDLADAPSLTFASTAVGSTSSDSPQTITVENIGNAALTFPVLSAGNNPSIAAGFTFNSTAPSACPLVAAGSQTAGTLAAGTSCQLPVSFTPTTVGTLSGSLALTDSNLNAAAPGYSVQNISLSGAGTQSTPKITWATPAAIPFGTPLSGAQLNASSTAAGSFTYSPAPGTVLNAGVQTLTATFTATDTTDYTTATATTTLTVNQATPAITWATPAAITYGTALSGTQLSASSPVAGTFTYLPAAGTVLNAGTQTLTVTFVPTDSTDYVPAAATVKLTVKKATLTINWATPAPISYGTALSGTQLDATSTATGTYAYSPAAGTVLAVGSHTLTVTFFPTNAANYTSSIATASVTLTVDKAAPAITWATPAAITYGTALGAAQLDAGSTAAGTLLYSPVAGTVLSAGQQTLQVTFTPTNTTDYTTAKASVTLTVNKATPRITWATPKAITYGTALSATQLDASSSVAGSFTYSPAAGTVPAVGQQTLQVTFTPTNTTDYTPAEASVTLTVNPAPTFTLSNSPASLTIAQGGTGKSTVTVSGQNEFAGSVSLAATGLPSGVTAAFGTNPATGTSVLTLTASSTAATGTTTVTIKGTSGNLTASSTIALTISCTPTTIVPYIYLNGAWSEESSVTVSSPSTVVDLGPQPSSGGLWSWTGPNGYTSTSRQVNSIPLTVGTDLYLATYTNGGGCKSTETFTIIVK